MFNGIFPFPLQADVLADIQLITATYMSIPSEKRFVPLILADHIYVAVQVMEQSLITMSCT